MSLAHVVDGADLRHLNLPAIAQKATKNRPAAGTVYPHMYPKPRKQSASPVFTGELASPSGTIKHAANAQALAAIKNRLMAGFLLLAILVHATNPAPNAATNVEHHRAPARWPK